MAYRTQAEMLFEKYLMLHAHTDWQYEVEVGGKRPDYRLTHHGSHLFFEVKEFDPPKLAQKADSYDLYKPIREKLNAAARQFKGCKDFSCSVVLSNLNCAIVQLGNPWVVMAAMLGDLAFQVPVGLPLGPGNRGRTIFTHGGKMVDDKRRKPWNTTFSSVIVLGAYSLHEKRIEAAARQRRQELGRNITRREAVEEALGLIEEMGDNGDARRVRMVVYENPFARIPLDRELFRGPFDERWGADNGFMRRVFVGKEIVRSESSLNQSATN
jgi:hypothetical protein